MILVLVLLVVLQQLVCTCVLSSAHFFAVGFEMYLHHLPKWHCYCHHLEKKIHVELCETGISPKETWNCVTWLIMGNICFLSFD